MVDTRKPTWAEAIRRAFDATVDALQVRFAGIEVGEPLPVEEQNKAPGADPENDRKRVTENYSYHHFDDSTAQDDISGGPAELKMIVVNTGKAGATITVKEGATFAAGDVIAIMDAASRGWLPMYADCPAGISVQSSDADVDYTVYTLP